jgi:hypothetical protein
LSEWVDFSGWWDSMFRILFHQRRLRIRLGGELQMIGLLDCVVHHLLDVGLHEGLCAVDGVQMFVQRRQREATWEKNGSSVHPSKDVEFIFALSGCSVVMSCVTSEVAFISYLMERV